MTDDTTDVEELRHALTDAALAVDNAHASVHDEYTFTSEDITQLALQLYRDRQNDFDPEDLFADLPFGPDDDDGENPYKVG